jgi:superoxide dismutase, Fe-Mn family
MNRISNYANQVVRGTRGFAASAGSPSFSLPKLPYAIDALEPHISKETLEFHHGKHHMTYVDNLNKFASQDNSLVGKSIEDIMVSVPKGPVFNNAAQVWNHTFYWNSMSPSGGGKPTGALAEAINSSFGSFEAFKDKFSATATGHFGSGWAWLVKGKDGKLTIQQTHDASNPQHENMGTPLLTCDVWEHAYYIDYRNARAKYVAAWWNVINWEFASKNFSQ